MESVSRVSSVERENQFSGKGESEKPDAFTAEVRGIFNGLRSRRIVSQDRRGTIPRRLLVFATSRRRGRTARTHVDEAGIAQDLHELSGTTVSCRAQCA